MKKIMLCCSAGMSTSLLMKKMIAGSRTAGPAGRDQRLWRSGVRRTGRPLSGGAVGAAGEIHAAGSAKTGG